MTYEDSLLLNCKDDSRDLFQSETITDWNTHPLFLEKHIGSRFRDVLSGHFSLKSADLVL
jgi:hypothetical protein